MISNDNYSNYNAFQIELQKRFTRDFSGQLSYTFGKTLDTGSDATNLGAGDTNITGPNDDFAYGYSRFDTRHRLTALGAYDLPFYRGQRDLAGQLLGGWKIAATFRYAERDAVLGRRQRDGRHRLGRLPGRPADRPRSGRSRGRGRRPGHREERAPVRAPSAGRPPRTRSTTWSAATSSGWTAS